MLLPLPPSIGGKGVGGLGGLNAYLDHARGRFYVLKDLQLGGRPMPALEVRVNSGIGLLGFEGILGLDFLGRFREIHFDVPSRRLTLTYS